MFILSYSYKEMMSVSSLEDEDTIFCHSSHMYDELSVKSLKIISSEVVIKGNLTNLISTVI